MIELHHSIELLRHIHYVEANGGDSLQGSDLEPDDTEAPTEPTSGGGRSEGEWRMRPLRRADRELLEQLRSVQEQPVAGVLHTGDVRSGTVEKYIFGVSGDRCVQRSTSWRVARRRRDRS